MSIPSLKIVFAGDSSVGKTSIIKRFTDGKYDQSTNPTINVNYNSKVIKTHGGNDVNLQLWDTAGQEAYRSISAAYFRNAKGIILVYDVSNVDSFRSLKEWIEMVKSKTNAPFIIFGNKADLPEHRVTDEEALAFADEIGVSCYKGSAKNGVNIEEIFYELTEIMNAADESQPSTKDVIVRIEPTASDKTEPSKCC